MNIPSELEKDVSITLQRTFLQRTGLNYNNYRVGKHVDNIISFGYFYEARFTIRRNLLGLI